MIRTILEIYVFVLILDIILSYLPQFRNYPAVLYIRKASEFTCGPVRKLLSQLIPSSVPFDFSPFVVIIIIKILEVLW